MAGTTEIPCRNLHQYIQSLMQTEPGENITSMELEFKKLSNLATTEPQRSDTLFLRFPMYLPILKSVIPNYRYLGDFERNLSSRAPYFWMMIAQFIIIIFFF